MPADSRDMVLVPREPTEAMVTAGALRLWSSPCIERQYTAEQWMGTAREVIREALSASPARGEGDGVTGAESDDGVAVCPDCRGSGCEMCCNGFVPVFSSHPTPATPEGACHPEMYEGKRPFPDLPAGEELREKVARIISPSAFEEETLYHDTVWQCDPLAVARERAFAKADAILAALQPQAVAGSCGGCGEADPAKRCIGCLHDFTKGADQ